MMGQLHQVSEFVGNSTISWTPTPAEDSEVVTNDTMSDDTVLGSDDGNLSTVLPIVLVLLVAFAIAIIVLCCRKRGYCMFGEKSNRNSWTQCQTKRNINHPASSVYTVQKEIMPQNVGAIYASNGMPAKSERALRYSGEPAVSSLPTAGLSVSYECLGATDMGSTSGTNQRDSVSSDYEYYNMDTLHRSAVQLSKSVEARSFLTDSRDSPERSLSSDQINYGRWPQVSRAPGSKSSSLGRDSGLGDSQETVPYYGMKASLSNFSMDSALDENSYAGSDYTNSPERPKSLPPMFGNIHIEDIKRVESSRLRGMNPKMTPLDENDNQQDIKHLRDQFYTIRNGLANKGQPVQTSQTFGTANFVIGIFGQDGGYLQLYDKSATLSIPPGAIHSSQEVYLYSFYENACMDGKSYLRRVIECGPDGLAFKKPVCLSFLPKLIPCDEQKSETMELNIVYKSTEREDWRSFNRREAFCTTQPEFVTIHVSHFTRFTVEPASSSGNQDGGAGAAAPRPPKATAKSRASSKKFYVSIFSGPTISGTIVYRICFTERDKQKLQDHTSCMQKEEFHQAIASPKLLLVDMNGGDVHIEVPSLHACDFKSKVKRHILPIDEFEDQTVEDIGPPQRELLLGPKGHNSEGLFEVSVFQENVHDMALTVCVSMNLNIVKEKLTVESSPSSSALTHRDVVEFLGGTKLLRYSPNVFFPKNMKLDICTKVEDVPSGGWQVLADEAQIPRNKAAWIESYVAGKHMTPCYVVLDFIEAKLISKKLSVVEACGQLFNMLERTGFQVAADYCNSWRDCLREQTSLKYVSGASSPQRDKGSRSHFTKHGDLAKLSQSREELGTIQEENTLQDPNRLRRRFEFGNSQSAQTQSQGPLAPVAAPPNQLMANGAVGGLKSKEQFEGRIYYENSQSGRYVSAPENTGHNVHPQNRSRPESGPYTIDGIPPLLNFMRPKQVLVKGNGGKAGRNDSGIGSDIASPVESEPDLHKHSHI